jgi:hypothetical protein
MRKAGYALEPIMSEKGERVYRIAKQACHPASARPPPAAGFCFSSR